MRSLSAIFQIKLVAQMVKNLPAMQEMRVWSLGWKDPLEKEMTTHSSILAWRIPWAEEPGRLQSMRSQRIRHNWATKHFSQNLPEFSVTCPLPASAWGGSGPFLLTESSQAQNRKVLSLHSWWGSALLKGQNASVQKPNSKPEKSPLCLLACVSEEPQDPSGTSHVGASLWFTHLRAPGIGGSTHLLWGDVFNSVPSPGCYVSFSSN